MKKLLIFVFISLLLFGITYANDIDNDYRQEILNNNLTYNTMGFFEAIRRNRKDMVALFLKAGMNPNATFSGSPAPMQALFLNKIEILDLLLSSGADVETEGPSLWFTAASENLLSYAIKKKNLEAVNVLIKNNVDINKKINGISPLNRAIKTQQPEIVKCLLNAGAISDENTKTLLEKEKYSKLKTLIKLNY